MLYSNGYGFNFQSFLRTMSPAYTTFCRRVAKVNCDEARGADVELDLSNDRTNPLVVTLLPALAAIVHRHSLIHAIPAWYPLFKPIPILLILGIIFPGNRVSRLSRIPT